MLKDEFGLSPDDYEVGPHGEKIVKDGRGPRVPMYLADAAPGGRVRVVAADGSMLGLHKPGFRLTSGGTADQIVDRTFARDDREAAYLAYDAGVSEAWRNPPTGAGSHGPVGQRAGDLCTINGWPGHLEDIDGELVCVPDRGRQDGMRADEIAADHHHRMAQIYDQLDRELSEAWRR